MYYNTTSETNPTLTKYRLASYSQDSVILAFFKKYPGKRFTPVVVAELADLPLNVPITSVRRSITTLTNAGHLVKTDEMRWGPMGRKSHTWTLKV